MRPLQQRESYFKEMECKHDCNHSCLKSTDVPESPEPPNAFTSSLEGIAYTGASLAGGIFPRRQTLTHETLLSYCSQPLAVNVFLSLPASRSTESGREEVDLSFWVRRETRNR